MSAAIAALASYGGSDSEPDSEPENEGGSQRSAAVLASRDAVLHLRPPPAAPPALPVDAAPEVAVKVGNPLLSGPGRPPARRCVRTAGLRVMLGTALEQPQTEEAGRKGRGAGRGALPPPGPALPCLEVRGSDRKSVV